MVCALRGRYGPRFAGVIPLLARKTDCVDMSTMNISPPTGLKRFVGDQVKRVTARVVNTCAS